jgi:hypothetical protein
MTIILSKTELFFSSRAGLRHRPAKSLRALARESVISTQQKPCKIDVWRKPLNFPRFFGSPSPASSRRRAILTRSCVNLTNFRIGDSTKGINPQLRKRFKRAADWPYKTNAFPSSK